MELMKQAEYARRCGVRKQALANWKKRGWLVFSGDLVDVAASDAKVKRYRTAGLHVVDDPASKSVTQLTANSQPVDASLTPAEQLRQLDWRGPVADWSYDAQVKRAELACKCIGDMVMVDSDEPIGDGNWGGWQLRIKAAEHEVTDPGQIWGGYGYELLRPSDILYFCREWIESDDEAHVDRPDLLYVLAYPYWEGDDPARTAAAT